MPKTAAPAVPKRNVVPDKLDLRDRLYMPAVARALPAAMKPQLKLPVLHQGETNACTGFALSNVVNFLLRKYQHARAPQISPFMLYSMARRYDEFPDPSKDIDKLEDAGSSLRGAMKGWYKHGACKHELWGGLIMPRPVKSAEDDWWLDAAQRPLGAYYRVDTRSVTDMHVALNEVGILYASAICHAGWDKGVGARSPRGKVWTIPMHKASDYDGGHAFIIVGYTKDGFLLQNSWGAGWGSRGLAILSYEDWLEHAMDCWVAQLGVVTEQHLEVARSTSLRYSHGAVKLASDHVLRTREISPFIIDMENNGSLSQSGEFRTQPSDVDAIVSLHLEQARKNWRLTADQPIDVAIYAHGGLVGEKNAAYTAGKWIPQLYEARIFPIFLMWESDMLTTLRSRVADVISGLPKPTGGLRDQLERFLDPRIERAVSRPGSMIWDEMKQNAAAITQKVADKRLEEQPGGIQLHEAFTRSPWYQKKLIRLHLIGHSAGAIVHSHVVERLAKLGWNFDSVNFLAPAVRVDTFEQKVLPLIKNGRVKAYNQFHLTDASEKQDHTTRAVLLYSRSLLYLVSQSFEHGVRTPILGMQIYFDALAELKLPNVRAFTAPSTFSASATHGGFDDDVERTLPNVVKLIKAG